MRNWALTAAALAAALWASPAAAQSTRTWVSGVGDDANPCTRTAPCKTFASAASKTADEGEINCLDDGAFGGLTITRSLSIVCDSEEAGVLTGANAAITINAANSRVLLSGLDINGRGGGLTGVRVLAAESVVVRNTIIQDFNGSPGAAVSVEGLADVVVMNSVILNNKTGIANPGSGSVRVGGTLIRNNAVGVSPGIGSFGTNQLDGNATNGKFSQTVPES